MLCNKDADRAFMHSSRKISVNKSPALPLCSCIVKRYFRLHVYRI